MSSDMLNVRDTATVLGVHENTVRKWEKSGVLRGIKLPGSGFRRFPRAEVERVRAEVMSSYPDATQVPDGQPSSDGRNIVGGVI